MVMNDPVKQEFIALPDQVIKMYDDPLHTGLLCEGCIELTLSDLQHAYVSLFFQKSVQLKLRNLCFYEVQADQNYCF